ncbi:recombinase family protein [Cytobacillus suaedae]|nr:recombinase family protein [Cytobacillus suaedae]
MRTVAYYRNSNNKYQENSLKTQKSMAFNYSVQKAHPIEEEYEDEDTSAVKNTTENRPGLSRLMKDIEAGTVKNLLVYKRDRLARSSIEYMEIYEFLKNHNVNVHFTSENEYPMIHSPIGEFIELIMSGMVEHEVKQMKERIAGTNFNKFERGEKFWSVPFGYRLNEDKNKIIRIEKELAVVEKIVKMVLSEEYDSLISIRNKLIHENIMNKGQNWKTEDIRKIFNHTIYMGVRYRNFKGFPEPAKQNTPHTKLRSISNMEWERACKLVRSMSKQRGKKEKPEFIFLLEGLLTCNLCNKIMLCENRTYQYKPVGKYVCECSKRGILKDEIEEIVLKRSVEFFQLIMSENYEVIITAYTDKQSERIDNIIEQLIQNEEKVVKELLGITEKWMRENNTMKKKEYKKTLTNLKERRDELNKEIKDYENEKKQKWETAHRLVGHYQTMKKNKLNINSFSEHGKKDLIQDIVQSVRVDNNELNIVFKHPIKSHKEVSPFEIK